MDDMTVLTQLKSDWPFCGHFASKNLHMPDFRLLYLSLVSIFRLSMVLSVSENSKTWTKF